MHSTLPFTSGPRTRHDWSALGSAYGKTVWRGGVDYPEQPHRLFPTALLTGSNFLSSSYHDAPWDEPELIQELIHAELGMLRKEKHKVRTRH